MTALPWYLSLHAFQRIFHARHLRLSEVEQLPSHSGSLRVYGIHADDPPDEMLILPWNIAEEIKAQLADLAERGTQFTIAVPALKVC